MRNALTRFAATFGLELRLIVVQWSFLLLQVVWAAMVIANFSNNPFSTRADTVLMSLALFIVPLASLVAMVIAALSASRAKRNRFDVLEAAYPTGTEIVLGRWLATLVAMTSLLIVPVLFALTVGPLDVFFSILPVFLIEAIILLAFITALIWLIQVTIGIRRWMYPLFAVFWLASGFVSSVNILLVPFAPLISYVTMGWNNFSYSETWGRLTIGNLPLLYNLFYAGLALLILGIIAWRYDFKRFYRQSAPAMVLAGGAFALTVVSFGGYTLTNVTITEQARQQDRFAREHRDEFTLPADIPYFVSAYDVTLDLADSAAPQFLAQLQIENVGDQPLSELDFTLNDQLQITESSIPFERERDFVHFALPEPLAPGESIPLDLSYQGALWYFNSSMIANRLREPQSFIHPGGVDLECAAAWYPVPGQIHVGRTYYFDFDGETGRITPDCIAAEPAQFRLRVENPGNLHFASNLPVADDNTFEANETTWASLVGAPELVIEPVGNIALITNASSLERVRPLIESYFSPALDYLHRIFPDVNATTITVLNGSEQSSFDRPGTPALEGRLVVSVANERDLLSFSENPYAEYTYAGRALINSLFGQGNSFLPGYTEDLAMFLWAHYKTNGDPEQMREILTEGFPVGNTGLRTYFSVPPELRWPVARLLLDIYVEQGESAVFDLLQEMRDEINSFASYTPDEISGWIEERANAD